MYSFITTGALAFGCLKNYAREAELLEELLAQHFWRRGKRGAWYDRLALVFMHHVARKTAKRGSSVVAKENENGGDGQQLSKEDKQKILQRAMDVIVKGLHDADTHIGQSLSLHEFDSSLNLILI